MKYIRLIPYLTVAALLFANPALAATVPTDLYLDSIISTATTPTYVSFDWSLSEPSTTCQYGGEYPIYNANAYTTTWGANFDASGLAKWAEVDGKTGCVLFEDAEHNIIDYANNIVYHNANDPSTPTPTPSTPPGGGFHLFQASSSALFASISNTSGTVVADWWPIWALAAGVLLAIYVVEWIGKRIPKVKRTLR